MDLPCRSVAGTRYVRQAHGCSQVHVRASPTGGIAVVDPNGRVGRASFGSGSAPGQFRRMEGLGHGDGRDCLLASYRHCLYSPQHGVAESGSVQCMDALLALERVDPNQQ